MVTCVHESSYLPNQSMQAGVKTHSSDYCSEHKETSVRGEKESLYLLDTVDIHSTNSDNLMGLQTVNVEGSPSSKSVLRASLMTLRATLHAQAKIASRKVHHRHVSVNS